MTTLALPQGLKPLATWDGHARDWGHDWGDDEFEQLDQWMKGNLGRHAHFACRFEVYVLDGPFAVVYSDRCGAGRLTAMEPAVVPLRELPPARLLGIIAPEREE